MKLVIPLVLIISLILLSTVVYFFYSIKLNLISELEFSAEIISSQLSIGLVNSMWNIDIKTIESQVYGEMKNPDIHAITVYDENSNLLLAKVKNQENKIISSDNNIEDNFVHLKKEIIKDGYAIGHVNVYLTDKYALENLWERIQEMMISIFIVNIAILLTLFFMVRYIISKRLRNLSQGFEDIIAGQGNFTKEIEVDSDDEIGDLTKTFKKMQMGLKDRNDLLNALLMGLKGEIGRIAGILMRKNIHKLSKKNPRILQLIPKKMAKIIKQEQKIEREVK